ncbi:hypothetical protein AGMMS49960_11280 [Betaproteobacteria bacterium]|nr:hypothetical protein AGMMS49543_24770 [Betaproteobacteria bacterium]GHU01317.1 hypothetical protein AGMMS49960_11280 [Betaproteobacteria bacterium]GHU17294.1 hypothetical protein AGMMS50243_05250 [Betaproteobacteria bacterium]
MHNKMKIGAMLLAMITMSALSAYAGYVCSEQKWSDTLEITSLQHIRTYLDVIHASREGKVDVVIDKANLGIEGDLYTVKILESTMLSASRFADIKLKHKILSSLRREWQTHPYPPDNPCVYAYVQDAVLKDKMEKSCLELRQYLNQYQ